MGPVRVRAHTTRTLSLSVPLNPSLFVCSCARSLLLSLSFSSLHLECNASPDVYSLTFLGDQLLSSKKLILPFCYPGFFITSYVPCVLFFHTSSSLRTYTFFLPHSFSHYFLYFHSFFVLTLPLFLSGFSFPPQLLPLPLSLHRGESSRVGLLNKYNTNTSSSSSLLCSPPLLPLLLLFLLSERQKGIIVFVSHIPIIPPLRRYGTFKSYCK